MVAETYAKGSGSRSKPIYVKYSPSHAERPGARYSREKGKGWERNKSSISDYGSDPYFCEPTYSHQRRAQSSMTGQRTDKHSNFYDRDGPANKPRRRRVSTEAITRPMTVSTTKTLTATPIGPSIPMRVRAVTRNIEEKDKGAKKYVEEGFADAEKSRQQDKVKPINREGARVCKCDTPATLYSAEAFSFPCEEQEDIIVPERCNARFMEMLITTEDFKERLNRVIDEGSNYQTSDTEPYPVYSVYRPEDNSNFGKFVNFMRIELKDAEVPPNRIVQGRIYVDLKDNTTVDAIGIDINKTFAMIRADGKVQFPPNSSARTAPELKLLPNSQAPLEVSNPEKRSSLPNDFALVETIPKRVGLQAGPNAIPFNIYVPLNQAPTFTYNSTSGHSVINNYSADVAVRINGVTERTGRVAISVPALGVRNVGYKDESKNVTGTTFILLNKYFTKDDGFDYAVGYTQSEGISAPNTASARLVRLAKCPPINLNDRDYVADLGTFSFNRGGSNKIRQEYEQNSSNTPLKTEWDQNMYDEGNCFDSTPTVSTNGFTCDYLVEITVGGQTYRGPVILVNRYGEGDLMRADISSTSKRMDFNVAA